MNDFDWYALTLKKDAWTMCDSAVLFETVNAEKLYNTGIVDEDDDKDGVGFTFKHLFETGIGSKKLIPLATIGGYDHFNPPDIIAWAITKEIPMPPRLLEWWEKQNKAIEKTSTAKNQDGIKTDDKPPSKNELRNILFTTWINETSLDINNMKKADIQNELIKINSHLFSSGFDDWWKEQTIHKCKSGRPKET